MDYAKFMSEAAKGGVALGKMVSTLLARSEPFAFQGGSADYDAVLDYFSKRLGVGRDGVVIVGSGKTGFSLNPKHPGTPFRHTNPESEEKGSDIDVAIIDHMLFDRYWDRLLLWRYPWHVTKWSDGDRNWALPVLENCFAGHFKPHEVRLVPTGKAAVRRELQSMTAAWFAAFKETSLDAKLGKFEFKGRLYRSESHAFRYHEDGIRLLAKPRR